MSDERHVCSGHAPAGPDSANGSSGDPLIGTVIAERYRVLALLGRGGMGSVYRAEHVHMKKAVALKVLHPGLSSVEGIAQRFAREAQGASRLDHEHIIQIWDFGRADGPQGPILYLAMELLEGRSLKQAIRDRGRFAPAAAVDIALQILSALEHSHSRGVVHRDLKPDNVMLVAKPGRADFVKILDFGIAKVSQPEGRERGLTQVGVVLGTPDYISPEQATGQTADGRADLYAVGVILYEMLCGGRPFTSDDLLAVLAAHLSKLPPPPRERAPEAAISPALEAVVLRALEKRREARFPSAAAMAAALGEARVLTAVPDDPPHRGSELIAVAVTKLHGRWAGLGARLQAAVRQAPELRARARAWLHGQWPGLRARLQAARRHALDLVARARAKLRGQRPVLRSWLRAARRLTLGLIARARLLVRAHPRSAAGLGVAAVLATVILLLMVPRDGAAPPARLPSIPASPAPHGPSITPAAQVNVDLLRRYLLDLQQARSCAGKREAIARLKSLGDERALPDLKRMRNARYGLLGHKVAHACVQEDLAAAIESLAKSSRGQ